MVQFVNGRVPPFELSLPRMPPVVRVRGSAVWAMLVELLQGRPLEEDPGLVHAEGRVPAGPTVRWSVM